MIGTTNAMALGDSTDEITVVDFIFTILSFAGIIFSWVLYGFYKRRSARNYSEKNFKEHVQFSLTLVDEKTNELKIRFAYLY